MTRPILLCITTLCLFACGESHEKSRPVAAFVSEGTPGKELHTYFTELASLERFNGAVLVRKSGEVVLRNAYNMHPDTAAPSYVDPGYRFDLRSVAKLLAKTTILRLEQEGKLRRSDPIGTYIPGFPRGDDISVQQLMDHQSGLPREFIDTLQNLRDRTPEEILALAKKEPLEFEPGAETRYSNVGYQILYYLIGAVEDKPFHEVLQARTFDPLGMRGSGSNFAQNPKATGEYAGGFYRDNTDSLVAVRGFLPEECRMGNLHSTVDDMDRYLQSLQEVEVGPLLEQGRLSHAGGTRGKRAYVLRDFKNDYSVVFLANYDGMPFERVVEDVQTLMAGGEVELPKEVHRTAITLDPTVLDRYTGTYDFVDAGHLLLELRLERDTLWVYQEGENNGPLLPESDSVFFGDPKSAESFLFAQDSTGQWYALMDFMGVRWKGERLDAP